MKAVGCTILWVASTMLAGAQQVFDFYIPLGGVQEVRAIQGDFYPNLQTIEMPSPTQYAQSGTHRLFAGRSGQDSVVSLGQAADPQVSTNFNGNLYNFRTPNDNDLAIANSGQLVSVTNSIIYFYDAPNGQFQKTTSLASFASSLGFTESKYDPKVVYDPEADRFVMVFLNGNLDSTSRIMLAFSQSNDPLGDWNLYALSGNPIANQTWSDFPNIGLSSEELFLTFNTFTNGSVNNSGFEESTIWQINKFDGYAGDSLRSRYFAGLNDNGKPFFNITPIMGGAGLYGPEMYFVSNRNLHQSTDTFYLFSVDNTIGNNGQLTYETVLSDQDYGLPPGAQMPGSDTLDCNDARVLGGFYENNILHFVGNTIIDGTGRPGIYHGQLTGLGTGNLSLRLNLIGDSVDLGYPNIAYVGLTPTDNSAILVVNFSSETVFPASGSLFFDGERYSRLSTIKEGISSVDVLTNTQERWGDYADVQRKYDEPGVVWSATSYARSNAHFTWIASLIRPFGVVVPAISSSIHSTVMPNPASHQVALDFTLDHPGFIRISLLNLAGQEVTVLLADQVQGGTHRFGCEVSHLPAGMYVLQGTNEIGEALFEHKIVKQ